MMFSKTKLKILQRIAKSPTHGYSIARELGVSISSIYEHLKVLEKEGFIAADKRGDKINYRMTENGRLLLKAVRINISEKPDTKA